VTLQSAFNAGRALRDDAVSISADGRIPKRGQIAGKYGVSTSGMGFASGVSDG